MKIIKSIYDWLINEYGPQGWWPLLELDNQQSINITKSGSVKGYHPGDYSYPKTLKQQFEIIVGAILTQNTSWIQVEKALNNLNSLGLLDNKKMIDVNIEVIKTAIKPAGYYNQKSERLKRIAKWFDNLESIPTRDDLLDINGIGPETADSILLYAYGVPSFVVDAYAKRILLNLGLIKENLKYDDIKKIFEDNIDNDTIIYQEYHALVVEHAKRFYFKKGEYAKCPLKDIL